MNKYLQDFARKTLKEDLAKLPDENIRKFKLMHGRNVDSFGRPTRSMEDAENMKINDVVDEIGDDGLDFAMMQVKRTLYNL